MRARRNSILCPGCRKLISADELNCPYCGLARPGLHNTVGAFRKIFRGSNPIAVIIYVNTALFVLALLLDPRAIFSAGGLFDFLSPSGQSLFLLGASGTIPVRQFSRVWTLISASFLHASAIHILFNMMALYQLGQFVLREFGFYRFVNLYLLSGVAGFAVSVLFGVSFTLGASASICGIIGAIIYYGKNRGGYYGEAIYKQAMAWVVGLIILGILFSGINNWAHAGGLTAGILLARLSGYNDQKPEGAWTKLFAYAIILVTMIILSWSVFYSIFQSFGPAVRL